MIEMKEIADIDEQTEAQDQPDGLQLAEPEPLSDRALEFSSTKLVLLVDKLQDGSNKIDRALAALSDAESRNARMTDRRMFGTDAMHRASFEEHMPPLAQAEANVRAVADEVFELAKDIDDATATDREPILSDEDAARANLRREFVKEDCAEGSVGDLVRKVKSAISTDDPATLWLYLRYGMPRVNEPREGDRRHLSDVSTLRELLISVRDRLADGRVKKTNFAAGELRKKALAASRRASGRQSTAAGSGRYSRF